MREYKIDPLGFDGMEEVIAGLDENYNELNNIKGDGVFARGYGVNGREYDDLYPNIFMNARHPYTKKLDIGEVLYEVYLDRDKDIVITPLGKVVERANRSDMNPYAMSTVEAIGFNLLTREERKMANSALTDYDLDRADSLVWLAISR